MNIIDHLAQQLSILRGHDNTEVAYINAPVDDLSSLAKTIMKGHDLAGDIQEAGRFHITLAIFPNFPNEAISKFLELSLPIRFNVKGTKLGTFPDAPSEPLLLMIDPDPALVRLQSDIYNAGIKMGLQLPDFDHFKASLWKPHVTLAMDVKNMPEQFAPINPVKLNIDRFVVQREGYDQIVEINLPGSIEDRPFITVRTIERHGDHVGQEGRKGVKGGSAPGFTHGEGTIGLKIPRNIVFDPNLTSEARYEGFRDRILIGPKFLKLPMGIREEIVLHEVGHALSDAMLKDQTAFDLQDEGAFVGDFDGRSVPGINGHSTPGENAAEAYAVFLYAPDWLQEHYPKAHEGIEDAIRLYGFPNTKKEALGPFKKQLDDLNGSAVTRIAPRTLEVSEEDFMAMLRGEVVVHGPSRRVLKFEDGPFTIRHGKHVDQKGRKGEKGGTEPGFKHEDGGFEPSEETRKLVIGESIIDLPEEYSENGGVDTGQFFDDNPGGAIVWEFTRKDAGGVEELLEKSLDLFIIASKNPKEGTPFYRNEDIVEGPWRITLIDGMGVPEGHEQFSTSDEIYDFIRETYSRDFVFAKPMVLADIDGGVFRAYNEEIPDIVEIIMKILKKQDKFKKEDKDGDSRVEEKELPLIADTPQGRKAAGKKVLIGLDGSVERGRPVPPKPKTIYADKKKEYPDYFKGQEKVGAAAFGTQVFTPFLEDHINSFEGSRQSAAREAFHRVVGAQKENNSDVHGFALSNNGQLVGVGSLNFKPENSPADGDFIDIESLVTSELGNTQAAMEKLINQAASEKRGISMNASDGAKDFLSSIGMRQDGKGTFFLTPEDIEGLASELKGPKTGQYIAPSSKPKIRQRFGRLFEEDEVAMPIDNRPPPISRENQDFQSRDKWDRFNWDAFQDPEMAWDPDMQMAGVFEENQNALFQDEIDEDAERGKSEILGKIKEGGSSSVAFGRMGQSVSELFGGKPRDMKNFIKNDKDYERDYGLDVVWPDGKIEDEEGANQRLSDFAHQAEGVRDEDSVGSWSDSTEYIYNRTQAALKEAGFETSDKVRLFRGLKAGSLPEDHDGGYVKLNLGAISSWTFNRSTAAHTATQGGRGTLLRVDVPISRIFSMWATGPGSREAMEYLILGQDGIRAWATKISRK